jgi:galactokinase
MCIVNTGGNHADLNDDYASVPGEMKAVAALFGKEVLRGVTEAQLIENSKKIRESEGDRALLRSLHLVRECERAEQARKSLLCGDGAGFFDTVNASGSSSFKYLQNVYTVKNVAEQGLSLALAITESMGDGVRDLRVHGGGFAGTVQCYIKNERVEEYTRLMDSVFGAGSVMCLNIRPLGETKIF